MSCGLKEAAWPDMMGFWRLPDLKFASWAAI